MRPRVDPQDRRLPEGVRSRLRLLVERGEPLQELAQFVEHDVSAPWWAAGGGSAGIGYMLRLGAVDRAVDALQRLADCEDWGDAPTGTELER